MPRRKMLSIACFFGLLMTSTIVCADAPPAFSTCIACHGSSAEGNVALGAPALAGQHGEYLQRQLLNFKQGLRGTAAGDVSGSQMLVVASSLSDQTIEQLSVYLSSLEHKASSSSVDFDRSAGRGLYNSTCSDCHGAQAEGNLLLHAPMLAGLDAQYLVNQFKKFQLGQRGYHVDDRIGKQMRYMSDSVVDPNSLNNLMVYIQNITGE